MKPPYIAIRVIAPASTPRKPATVITATSRWATCDSSWASTPSSSSGSSRRSRPVVTQTTAFCGLRPVAKAFGMSLSATATRGLGMSASAQSRSTAPCSCGYCSGVTRWAPIARSVIRSLNQNWATNRPPEISTTIGHAPRSSTISRPVNPTYNSPIRNIVPTMRPVRPRSGAKRVCWPELDIAAPPFAVRFRCCHRAGPAASPARRGLRAGSPRPGRSCRRTRALHWQVRFWHSCVQSAKAGPRGVGPDARTRTHATTVCHNGQRVKTEVRAHGR